MKLNNRNQSWCISLAALGLGLAACQPGDELVGESMRVVEFEVLAELTTPDGASVVFTREPVSDGSDEYTVGVKMIGPSDGIAYGQFITQQGLSPLEIFTAFAPAGAEAPEELIASHAAAVAAEGRTSDEVRELKLPRTISTSPNHSNCDDYVSFADAVDATWTTAQIRSQVHDEDTGSQTIGKNNWHSGFGMACNADAGSNDAKNVYMCRKLPSDVWFTCEWTTLDDGEYGWKIWSASGNTEFHFQLNAANPAGATLSYLGLVVAATAG